MSRERIPWHLLVGLILGIGLGLVISWLILPQAYTVTSPAILRADFKDAYRAQIAAAYAATGDLPRAAERLATLGDEDAVRALTIQAQHELAAGNIAQSESLAGLAAALQAGEGNAQISATTAPTQTARVTSTVTLIVAGAGNENTPEPEAENPDIPISTPTDVPYNTVTPAPTSTPIPTINAPYILMTQDEVCNEKLSEGLLMVFVSDALQKPLAGVEIIVEWSGNEEHFFTGLKPELGTGYADFTMQPNQSYAVRLATGSTAVADLSAPPCQDEAGNHYWGSVRLRFQKP